MTITQAQQLLVRILGGICIGILVLIPFHAFLTIFAAHLFDHYTTFRLWKEILLGLAAALALILVLIDRPLKNQFVGDWLMRLIGIYALVIALAGGVAYYNGGVSRIAMADGILLDLRFLLFFVVTWVLTRNDSIIFMNWRKILIGPALVVVGFGLLQRFSLPYDALKHVGYGASTIQPFETVDEKSAYIRLQSTLRGANPLGSYLVIIVTAIATIVTRVRANWSKLSWVAIGLLALVVMFFTYSRSAWIGTLLSVGALVVLGMRHRRHMWRISLVAVLIFMVAASGGLYLLRDNDFVQNVFFHTDEHSLSSVSSNEGRLAGLTGGFGDLFKQPLGGGTGTAGPASTHNSEAPVRIAENYFVQIGQEAGLIGLGLFIAINVLVARRLWLRDQDSLSRILFSSLIGISFICLVSHAWTDDTLAYLWWGFAGVAVARVRERKHEDIEG